MKKLEELFKRNTKTIESKYIGKEPNKLLRCKHQKFSKQSSREPYGINQILKD